MRSNDEPMLQRESGLADAEACAIPDSRGMEADAPGMQRSLSCSSARFMLSDRDILSDFVGVLKETALRLLPLADGVI